MAGRGALSAALAALYRGADAEQRKQAEAWLQTWQTSQEAWSVADSALHDDASSAEERIFAAQTLRTKVSVDFEELPGDAALSLRDSLYTLLVKYATTGPAAVRTTLCVAVAACATHLPPAAWADAGGLVRWSVARFQREDVNVAVAATLQLLAVLPEEVNSTRIAVRRRGSALRTKRTAMALTC